MTLPCVVWPLESSAELSLCENEHAEAGNVVGWLRKPVPLQSA